MKSKKIQFALAAGFLCLVSACTLVTDGDRTGAGSQSGNRAVIVQNGHKTGAKLPSSEELQRLRKGLRTVVRVHPNALWQKRLAATKPNAVQSSVSPGQDEIDTVSAQGYTASSNSSVSTSQLPNQVNNALLNSFPPIGDQVGIGSCAAFSTTYYTLTHEVGLKYGINNRGGIGSPGSKIFSPKWTYNLVNGGGDYGSWMTSINELIGEVGAATWDDFPYNGDGSNPINYLEWALDSKVWLNAMKFRIPSQGSIPVTDTLSEIKGYLANGHVVTFATGIFSWHYQNILDNPSSNSDTTFVGKSALVYMDSQNAGGHSMTVVGYNDDVWVDINNDGIVQPQELGVFIIANQWGTGFGDNGFTYATYDSVRLQSTAGLTNSDRIPALWNNEFYYIDVQKYDPTVVASFTLNQAQRNQLYVTYSPPSGGVYNTPLRYAGGAYSFAGTTTPCDATFFLDVSSFITSPSSTVNLQIQDGYVGSITAVKGVSVIDLVANRTYPILSTEQTVDNSIATYLLSESQNQATPAGPANLSALVRSSSQIDIAWTDVATNEDGYRVFTSTSNVKPTTPTATLEPNSNAYSFTGLSAATLYYFWVDAYNAVGVNTTGATTFATTSSPTPTPSPGSEWTLGATYSAGTVVSYQGSNYRCVISHTAYSADWNPGQAPALWLKL